MTVSYKATLSKIPWMKVEIPKKTEFILKFFGEISQNEDLMHFKIHEINSNELN